MPRPPVAFVFPHATRFKAAEFYLTPVVFRADKQGVGRLRHAPVVFLEVPRSASRLSRRYRGMRECVSPDYE